MLLHDQDKMPPRDVLMKDDDFDYLIDFILHHRYLASSDYRNDERIYLFETARTILIAAKHISKGTIFLYDPIMTIDLEKNECIFTAGIRYLDNWHTEDSDCLLKMSFGLYKRIVGYKCEFIKNEKVLDKIFYSLSENKIYSYDMNFPFPTEFRRVIKRSYNRIVSVMESKKK